MNTFWNFIDWFLPSIRLSDDLEDPEALSENHFSVAYHGTTSSYPPSRFRSNPPLVVDRGGGIERQREQDFKRGKERSDNDERVRALKHERENDRKRIRNLEEEVKRLQRDLDAKTKEVVDFIDYPAIPSSSDKHAEANKHDLNEELASLRSFLNKTDVFSGADILQTVVDLNAKIVLMAANITDAFAQPPSRVMTTIVNLHQLDQEPVWDVLGPTVTDLLATRDIVSDPILAQLAIQAWVVFCVGRIFDCYCYGLSPEVNSALSTVLDRMQCQEPQAMVLRWRALTYTHAKNAYPSDASLKRLASSIQRGLHAILHKAFYRGPAGLRADVLYEHFGGGIAEIVNLAERLAYTTKTGVQSASYDVTWIRTGERGRATTFHPTSMDNEFFGHGSQEGDVSCTVTFGLVSTRITSNVSDNPSGHIEVTTTAQAMDGHTRGRAPSLSLSPITNEYPQPSTATKHITLLKPKVLLDNVAKHFPPETHV